jgi:hypothetical protein
MTVNLKKFLSKILNILFNNLCEFAFNFGKELKYNKKSFIEIALYKLIEVITNCNVLAHKSLSLHQINTKKKNYLVIKKKTFLSNHAILIQGPIYNNFTIESIKILKNQNPKVKIFFSTWKNENRETLVQIKKLVDEIILNDSSKMDPGHINMNLQIKTTASGLLKLKKIGFKYVLKMRSDEFVSVYNICQKFERLLENFPQKKITNNSLQKKRLVILETHIFNSWHIPDRLMFGNIDDLLNYWHIEPCSITNYNKIYPYTNLNFKKDKLSNFYKYGSVEHYLATQYCKKINFNFKNDIFTWLKFLSEKTIIVDREMIGHHWPKHDHMKFSKYKHFINPTIEDCFVNFKLWLRLYDCFYDVYNKDFEKIFNKYNFLDSCKVLKLKII